MALKLYNTLTRSKDVFTPIEADNVRMYVCGPTVYDFAHIGNARPVIVFDVLFRLLRHLYGESHVKYVRNITDVDDKINARALRDFPDLPLNDAIARVTSATAEQFHADVEALGCLRPTHEPRATQHISGMIEVIQTLLDKGHAYAAAGEVLFDVRSMPNYGELSGRDLDANRAGARVVVDAHKRDAADFVLWKLSSPEEPGWESPWGRGRPGWHIECSAMSKAFLGETFDIHGGGLDLIFPHHENEIAQSTCASGHAVMANTWMHNGFVQVEGKKMSKSEGNFVTIHDLLHTDKFGGRRWDGEVLRLAMLSTDYKQPIDWTVRNLEECQTLLNAWMRKASYVQPIGLEGLVDELVVEALCDDLNTPRARSRLSALASQAEGKNEAAYRLAQSLNFLGLTPGLHAFSDDAFETSPTLKEIVKHISEPRGYQARLFLDTVAPELELRPIVQKINFEISLRLAARVAKNWAESDRIRDELAAQGIILKDHKDGTTTWEVKR